MDYVKTLFKNVFFLFVFLYLVSPTLAVDLTYDWGESTGGDSRDKVYSIATDANNNIYVCGEFEGSTIILNPEGDDFNYSSAGSTDIFILKYDQNNVLQWSKVIGGTGIDKCYDIAVDTNNDVYFAGQYANTVNFNPDGSDSKTSNGSGDLYLSKLTSGGVYAWTVTTGGSSSSDRIYSLDTDSLDNIAVTGGFNGTNINFNPLGESVTKTSVGNNDIFIAQYDSDGNLNWIKTMGSTSLDEGLSVNVSSSDEIVVTGTFWSTVNFNPDGSDNRTASDWSDGFITKYNSSGTYQWTKVIGGDGNESPKDVVFGNNGQIYVSGTIDGTANFNPDGSVEKTAMDTTDDFFIAQYASTDGAYSWVQVVPGTGYDYVNDIAVDSSDNLYMVGYFDEELDFDPDEIETDTYAADTDIFLTHYDGDGNYLWTHVPTTSNYGWGEAYGVAVDSSDSVLYAGYFSDVLDFDPVGTDEHTSYNSYADMFIVKYTSGEAVEPTSTPVPTATPTPTSGVSITLDLVDNVSTVTSSTSSDNPTPPSCQDLVPDKQAYWSYDFLVKSNSVDLGFWYPEINNHIIDGYLIRYGLSSGDYSLGGVEIDSTSGKYMVEYLEEGRDYYFVVAATNGCAVGPWSKEVKIKTTLLGEPELTVYSEDVTVDDDTGENINKEDDFSDFDTTKTQTETDIVLEDVTKKASFLSFDKKWFIYAFVTLIGVVPLLIFALIKHNKSNR